MVTTYVLEDFGWAVVWIGLFSVCIFTSAAYELQRKKWPMLELGACSAGRVLKAPCLSASNRFLLVSSICSLLPIGTSKSME